MGSRREVVKRTGVYLLVGLGIFSLLLRPLDSKIKRNREVLLELKETYLLKKDLYEKKLLLAQESPSQVEPKALSLLYPPDVSYNSLRTKVLRWLMEKAEEKGLTVTNFEIPELRKGKTMTEINLILRLKGRIKPFLEYLKEVESADKLILVRTLELYPSRDEFDIRLTFSFFRREM